MGGVLSSAALMTAAAGLVMGGLMRGALVMRALVMGALNRAALVMGALIRAALVMRALIRAALVMGALMRALMMATALMRMVWEEQALEEAVVDVEVWVLQPRERQVAVASGNHAPLVSRGAGKRITNRVGFEQHKSP